MVRTDSHVHAHDRRSVGPQNPRLSRQERGSIWTMWALLVLALSYVHRRIAGTHHLLDLVNLTPATGGGIVGVVLIFLGFSVAFATVSSEISSATPWRVVLAY